MLCIGKIKIKSGLFSVYITEDVKGKFPSFISIPKLYSWVAPAKFTDQKNNVGTLQFNKNSIKISWWIKFNFWTNQFV